MVFFLLLVLFIVFNSLKIAPSGYFISDYMSKDRTNAVKGIFVLLILFSHFEQYVTLSGVYDFPYLELKQHLHQMVVAMFLFYSGYGIMESIKTKGVEYVKNIPMKRLLLTWINFVLAVCLYLIVGVVLGNVFERKQVLLAFVAYTSVGNSNWYMFVIFILYILVYISYNILRFFEGRKGRALGTLILTVLTIGFIFVEIRVGLPSRFYNTAILYVMGCWYSLLKDYVEKIIMKNSYVYTFIICIMICMYVITYHYRSMFGIEGYTIWALTFTMLVILTTMKIGIGNPILHWFGEHVFSVYILQRIPMILISRIGLTETHRYVSFILVIACTVFMAMVFDWFTGKLNYRILKNFDKIKGK